ncbi:MAG: hypothetical protein NNA20_12970, partial [Nitrospira sp.]|nr:hypothetical protein [Nitrospira sp.]
PIRRRFVGTRTGDTEERELTGTLRLYASFSKHDQEAGLRRLTNDRLQGHSGLHRIGDYTVGVVSFLVPPCVPIL